MNKKAIFLDIDGTLTEPGQNEPPASALKAIRAAQDRGHLVFLCTGRNLAMLEPLLKYRFDGVVGSSGGYITVGDRVINDCPMTEEQKMLAMTVLKKNRIFRTVECLHASYTDEGLKETLRANPEKEGNSEFLRWREQVEKNLHILPMAQYENQPAYKIVTMMTEESDIEGTIRELQKDFQVVIQDRNPNGMINGEIVNRKCDKGRGIQMVCDYLQIPIENTIAIGDSMNDREMLEAAGLSICMDNGAPAMKALADEVCPAVTEDGLYRAFEKHHLM